MAGSCHIDSMDRTQVLSVQSGLFNIKSPLQRGIYYTYKYQPTLHLLELLVHPVRTGAMS